MTKPVQPPKKATKRGDVEKSPDITTWEVGAPQGRGLYERRGRYENNLVFIGIMEDSSMARHVTSIHNRLNGPIVDVP